MLGGRSEEPHYEALINCHRGSARGRKRLGDHEQGLQERLSCMVLSDFQHPAPCEAQLILRPKATGTDALPRCSGA
jgi:hypothetical protein